MLNFCPPSKDNLARLKFLFDMLWIRPYFSTKISVSVFVRNSSSNFAGCSSCMAFFSEFLWGLCTWKKKLKRNVNSNGSHRRKYLTLSSAEIFTLLEGNHHQYLKQLFALFRKYEFWESHFQDNDQKRLCTEVFW